MPKHSPLILALAGLASAVSIQKIPLPEGTSLTEAGLAVPRSGLLVFVESHSKAYQTSDLGAHWDIVPNPTGSGPEAMGTALTSYSGAQVWTGSAWIDASFPAGLANRHVIWNSANSEQSFGAEGSMLDDSSYVVLRSDDSLRSWREWFRIPAHSIPKDADFEVTNVSGGRLWLPQDDSVRWQTTSDGIHWLAISYPPGSRYADIQKSSGDTIVAITNAIQNLSLQNQITVDGGLHWTAYPLSQPGVLVLSFQPGIWLSPSAELQGDHVRSYLHAAASSAGPWVQLSSAPLVDMVQGDALYFADTTGLYRADLAGLASVQRSLPAATGFELRRTGGHLVAVINGIRPLRWSLAAADGTLLASGVATESFEVPAIRDGAFLTVEGMGAKRIPPTFTP